MENFTILGLTVYPYGLAVALAGIAALLLARAEYKKRAVRPGALSWAAVLMIPLGFLGARLGYCLSNLDWVSQQEAGFFFQFTSGGYHLYGAMAGAALALLLASRIARVPFARLSDGLAAPAALMIALCRLAEGLVGEGYGWNVRQWFMEDEGMSLIVLEDTGFFERFPFAIPNMYGSWRWAVFVVEALIALGICAVLLRQKRRKAGGQTALLLILYAATQLLGESMRQDAVLRWGFVRVNQVLGAVVLAGTLALCAALAPGRNGKKIACGAGGLVASFCLVAAMEFALEKKIGFLEWMPMDVCYVVMAGACALAIGAVLPLWRRAFPLESAEK